MAKPRRAEIRRLMSYLGSITSPAKAAAARQNGRLGGRPRKKKVVDKPNARV